MDEAGHEINFYTNLSAFYKKGKGRKPWKRSEMFAAAQDIKNAKQNSERKNRRQYHLLTLYDVLEVDNKLVVIRKRKSNEDPIILITPYEDLFKILYTTHANIGHGCRDKMIFALKSQYQIPRSAVEIFVATCEICRRKRIRNVNFASKALVSKVSCPRGAVDIIDMTSCPDDGYNWMLNYQDNLTKYIFLRPLKSDSAVDVATELLKIFLQTGAPAILHSDKGSEFVREIIVELVSKWGRLKILIAKSVNYDDPHSLEIIWKTNHDVQSLMYEWMKENNSINWSLGCHFVQFKKNQTHLPLIGCTPHKALFGSEINTGISCSSLSDELISTVETEEELENLLKLHTNCDEPTEADKNLEKPCEIKTEIEDSPDNSDNSNSEVHTMTMSVDLETVTNFEEVTIKTEEKNTFEDEEFTN